MFKPIKNNIFDKIYIIFYMKEKKVYCKACDIYYNTKYWVYHKYTKMHIENYTKSDEDEYESISNYLIVKLKSK